MSLRERLRRYTILEKSQAEHHRLAHGCSLVYFLDIRDDALSALQCGNVAPWSGLVHGATISYVPVGASAYSRVVAISPVDGVVARGSLRRRGPVRDFVVEPARVGQHGRSQLIEVCCHVVVDGRQNATLDRVRHGRTWLDNQPIEREMVRGAAADFTTQDLVQIRAPLVQRLAGPAVD